MGRQSRRGVTACLSLVSDTGDPEHVRSLPVLVGGPITSAEGSPMLARGPLVSVEEPQMSVRGSPYQLRACIGHCLTVTAKGLRVGQEPSITYRGRTLLAITYHILGGEPPTSARRPPESDMWSTYQPKGLSRRPHKM